MNDAVEKYRSKFQSYSVFATRLESLVTQLIEQSGTKVHFVESRAKSPESFAEKICRPGKQYKSPLDEIPDLIGIRVVLYYSDSVKGVGDLLKREFDVLEEETGHQATAYGADQFGYLSMHYVVKLHSKRRDLAEWQEWHDVRAEIQVRTVLQHSWAAVSHALQYKREGDVPLALRRRLHRLAGLFEIADEEFVGIRKEASAILKATKEELKSNPATVPLDANSLEYFLRESAEFKRLREQAIRLGYKFGRPPGHSDDGEDEKDYVASVVEASHRLGINFVAELEQLLKFDAEPFLKGAKKGDWWMSEPFFALLLLIKAKPDAFSVKGLQTDGFHPDIAKRILAATKAVE